MLDMSPIATTAIMFLAVIVAIMIGYPLAFSIGGVALLIGFFAWGSNFFITIYLALWGTVTNYVFLAAPLFIFMGNLMGFSGVADKLFNALHLLMGGIRGGLALATIVLGTAVAACVGIMGASVTMLGLICLPPMIKKGYQKELACGVVCAGGTLGILIPPSMMLLLYGPTASISVGKLFMGAFMPGLLLALLYFIYTLVACYLDKTKGPPLSPQEIAVPLSTKLSLLLTSLLPLLFLILAVLGSIFFGIAAPTEAAAVGALASIILAAAYRKLNWKILKSTMLDTIKVGAYVIFFAAAAFTFTGVFLGLGCGQVVKDIILHTPGGNWGVFFVTQLIVFLLGFFIDWMAIIFIIVPIITPIGTAAGFDKLWFALMVCVNLQTAFITPPLAYAIFYLKGIIRPELGVETIHIIRGVIPFVLMIVVGLGLLVAFPEIITWLPSVMIK